MDYNNPAMLDLISTDAEEDSLVGEHGLSPLREREHPVEELDGGAIDLPSILSAGYNI